jgi:uncharacterized protein (DUF433 family)
MTHHLAARAISGLKIIVGKPVINGTRIPVHLIFRRLGAGDTEELRLADHSCVNIDDIRAGYSN